ncbi:MAG: ATP-binding protein [Oscillospiraceae bacterium]|jgi:hypothetical protein|nr:ATP-binding protein [Oscillospiraceae bacterium]
MNNFTLTPNVDAAQEFIEIANDFTNPLDLVREAISNSFDAGASQMDIIFETVTELGERILKIIIRDNGSGMSKEGLQSFFDLGNSMRRNQTNDYIGEKGHGTKVYFNSTSIQVETVCDGLKYSAFMDAPKKTLYSGKMPIINVDTEETHDCQGTSITIMGFNNNRSERFNHDSLRDYIIWFTKIGSIELEFDNIKHEDFILNLKGLDLKEPEQIKFGHVFPQNSKKADNLFDTYLDEAPNWYCKKIKKSGHLRDFPDVSYDAIFCIEGTRIKYSYNPMIRRSGYTAPKGSYTIQERYGLWLCKDFIPIQKKNEWITTKGSEYTKFHAFVNCQALKLTANRGSIENTQSEILENLREEIRKQYEEIVTGDDWMTLSWLETEALSNRTVKSEKREFEKRIKHIKKARIALLIGTDKKEYRLVEPNQENGVYALLLQLEHINPGLFPFTIVDYNTRQGIDVIVKKSDDKRAIGEALLQYVELKHYLKPDFNHSFESLNAVVCWDITQSLVHGSIVQDIGNKKRTLKIIPPANDSDYTKHYLDDVNSTRKIEVFVLSKYLREKCGINFRTRTQDDLL